MPTRLSRTKIARHVSKEIAKGNTSIVRELAGYLLDERRTKEVDVLVRSIYDELERDGVVVADVTTAHGLSTDMKAEIKTLLEARRLELREHTDKSVLGGIRVNTPSRVLDATVANRLMKLRERKV